MLVVVAVSLALWFYRTGRRTRRGAGGRERTLTEASDEIGAPPEAIDPDKALLSDRMAGVSRPLVSDPPAARTVKVESSQRRPDHGSLKERPIRKDNLSKEVELDWEAAELIEVQPGAYAYPRDFRDKDYVLPDKYGKERLVLMARDPRWIYAYWEVARDRYQELRERRLSEWGLSRPVLRMYDLTEPSPWSRHFDVDLADEAEDWYVRVDRPRHNFVAELGRVFPDGFVALVRSNEVCLPPEAASMEVSEEWAPLDWDASYGRFIAKVGTSSPLTWGK